MTKLNHTETHNSSWRIVVGLAVGLVIGLIFHSWGPHPARDWLLANILLPAGTLFLRLLFMIVVPLVFSSLLVGVANLGSLNNLSRLGGRLALFYLGTTLVAIILALFLADTIGPGRGIDPELVQKTQQQFSAQVSALQEKSAGVPESLWPGLISSVVPKNVLAELAAGNMLATIFTAIFLGLALLGIDREKSVRAVEFFSAISDACVRMVGWIMRIAPVAVAALMASAVTQMGWEILEKVLLYVGVVLVGYLLQFVLVYGSVLRFLLRLSPLAFYRKMAPVFATAFATSSSSATMPTTMRTLEKEYGLPNSLVSFSIPLGATVNMDGTALFEALAALFIAQVFQVPIDLLGQVTLVLLVVLTSIGVAGVPGGSIPLLMSVLGMLHIPPEGIALILGVDRLLDMGRTVVNVTGDCVAALYLARVERVPLK